SALRNAVARQDMSARYHTALGEMLVYRGQADEGFRHYERALQLHPDYGPACALMGRFYLEKATGPDALERAEPLLLQAIRSTLPHIAEVYRDLGPISIRKSQYPQAIAYLKESLRKDSNDERAYYALSNAYRRAGDSQAAAEAEKRFRQLSALHV